MSPKPSKRPYVCQCRRCVRSPNGPVAQLHSSINDLVSILNEKERRQFVGLLALQLGHGGIQTMVEVTGLSRNTIARGRREIKAGDSGGLIRAAGAGRLRVEKKSLSWRRPWKP
jgi:hypothetical protein